MRVCKFNFNNEVDQFDIHVEDDGRVSIPGENDTVLAEYDSIEQLAQIYAQARDVKPENLKNWVLLEHGNVYSFVLRAGTAGVNICDVEEQLDEAFASLAGKHHELSIARAKEQIMADGMVELVSALVHCTETGVARDVYDAMSAVIQGTDMAETEEPEEEEDTRTDLERYVDEKAETPGALGFLAMIAGLPADSEKDVVVEALRTSVALSNINSLQAVFNNAIVEACNEGIGVNSIADALTVLTQTVSGERDEEAKNRMIVAARMAGRNAVNVSVDIVGETHIRHTAELVSLDELTTCDLLVRENAAYIVRFDRAVDAELEAERDAVMQEETDEGDDDNDDVYEEDED